MPCLHSSTPSSVDVLHLQGCSLDGGWPPCWQPKALSNMYQLTCPAASNISCSLLCPPCWAQHVLLCLLLCAAAPTLLCSAS